MRLWGRPNVDKLTASRDVAGLTAALDDRESDVRERAARALGDLDAKEVGKALVRTALQDDSPAVRAAAADAVARLGGESAIGALTRALGHESPHVRSQAVRILGRIAEPRAVGSLVTALGDKKESVREAARETLRGIAGPSVIRSLTEAALAGKTAIVRNQATTVLSEVGGATVVDPLIGALSDKRAPVRERATKILGAVGGPGVLEHLQAALDDPSPAVRKEAAKVLRAGSGRDPTEALIATLDDTSESVRVAAVKALGEVGVPDVVEPLVAALSDGSEPVVMAAIRALGDIGDRRAVDVFITALDRPLDERPLPQSRPAARIEIARALGKLGDHRAIDALARCLRDTDSTDAGHWGTGDYFDVYFHDRRYPVSEAASQALSKIGGPAAKQALTDWVAQGRPIGPELPPPPDIATLAANRDVDDLIQSLAFIQHRSFQARGDSASDESREVGASVRRDAAEALGRLGDRRAAEALAQRLTDYDDEVREAAGRALESLGLSGEEAAVLALTSAGLQGSWTHREALVRQVAAIGPRAVDLLRPALADEKRLVRENAARTLAEIGSPAAIEALEALLSDFDPGVRETAAKALGRIGVSQAMRNAEAARQRQEQEQQARAVHAASARLAASRDAGDLVGMLADADEDARSAAEAALTSRADAGAIERLASLLEHEQAQTVAAAARILTRLGDPRGSAWVLIDASRRDERGLYDRAARNLERAGAVAVPLLEPAVHDESTAVRWSVAHVLGRCAAREAVPSLIELLEDPDAAVSDAALAGLRRIGGSDAEAAIAAHAPG